MSRKFLSDAIELPDLGAAPAAPGSGRMLFYSLSGSLYQKNAAGAAVALDALGGGAPATGIKTVETNLGVTPRKAGSFVVIDALINVGNVILVEKAAGPYTTKGTLADEATMDSVVASAVAGAGQMTVYWNSDGPVKSYMKFNYVVGSPSQATAPSFVTATKFFDF